MFTSPGPVVPSPTSSAPLTSLSPPPSNCWKLTWGPSDLLMTLTNRDEGGGGGGGGGGGDGGRGGGWDEDFGHGNALQL